MVCSGKMNGKGEILCLRGQTATPLTARCILRERMQMGQNATPVEWTVNSTSTYKGPDCGSVKPMPMPQN